MNKKDILRNSIKKVISQIDLYPTDKNIHEIEKQLNEMFIAEALKYNANKYFQAILICKGYGKIEVTDILIYNTINGKLIDLDELDKNIDEQSD